MPLQAGAARVDITPEVGCHLDGNLTDRRSQAVHDPLYAKAVVVERDGVRLGLVVCDLIIVTREMADAVKSLVAAQAGIPPERLLVTATHTHYAPAVYGALLTTRETDYAETVPLRIAAAVMQAADKLQPAQVGWAAGECASECFNRRWHLSDGTVKMNPGIGNPNLVEPAGPADPKLTAMVVRTPERQPIAVVGNLSLHYVGSANGDISSDYFGFFDRALQRMAGGEFVAAMTNACFGDINNINYGGPPRSAPDPYHHCERVGNVAAAAAYQAWQSLREEQFDAEPELAGVLELVPLTPRQPTAEQIAAAQQYLLHQPIEPDVWSWTYAVEHLRMMLETPAELSVPLQALRIGEGAMVGLPGEVFAEIGLAIRAESPFQHLMPIGLANDTVGYVAPDHQLDWGGYECTLCRHVIAPKGTSQTWQAAAGRLLQAVQAT